MPVPIEMLIVVARFFTVAARRNLYLHALALGLRLNGIAVVAFIRNQMLGIHTINELCSLRTIR